MHTICTGVVVPLVPGNFSTSTGVFQNQAGYAYAYLWQDMHMHIYAYAYVWVIKRWRVTTFQ